MIGSSAKTSSASESGLSAGHSSLVAGGVHLWLCASDRIVGSDEFKRRVLSRYTGVAPAKLRFELGEHGKPVLEGMGQAFDFNVSHSGDWLVCAVTTGTPVGVDLEFCDLKRASLKVARRFFHPEEVAVLEACSEAQLEERFYDLWTLKESGVKARGEALAPGLASRNFTLTFSSLPGRERGHIEVTTADTTEAAHYCLLDPLPGYRVAVCWLPGVQLEPQLQLFELGESDEVIERFVPLRASSWLN